MKLTQSVYGTKLVTTYLCHVSVYSNVRLPGMCNCLQIHKTIVNMAGAKETPSVF